MTEQSWMYALGLDVKALKEEYHVSLHRIALCFCQIQSKVVVGIDGNIVVDDYSCGGFVLVYLRRCTLLTALSSHSVSLSDVV